MRSGLGWVGDLRPPTSGGRRGASGHEGTDGRGSKPPSHALKHLSVLA